MLSAEVCFKQNMPFPKSIVGVVNKIQRKAIKTLLYVHIKFTTVLNDSIRLKSVIRRTSISWLQFAMMKRNFTIQELEVASYKILIGKIIESSQLNVRHKCIPIYVLSS